MNWFNNLCSCISPNFKQNIIGYLNSSNLNREVIEEQKVTQETRDVGQEYEPQHNIYTFAKSKSVNFMRLQENSDEESDEQAKSPKKKSSNKNRKPIFSKNANSHKAQTNQKQEKDEQEEEDEIMDVFWYPKYNKNKKIAELLAELFVHKRKIFDIIMQQEPSNSQYDKIYDSLDQTKLIVYCKLQSLLKGRKINSYRFSFEISGVDINTYQKWVQEVDPKQVLPLLQQLKKVSSNSIETSSIASHSFFKKLLIVSPQDFITVHKIYEIEEKQEKTLPVIFFSIKEEELNENSEEGYTRAWLHLSGLEAIQIQNGVKINGYLCFDVDLSVSPNMLKQPISKQIRIFAQKMICNIRKSDGI